MLSHTPLQCFRIVEGFTVCKLCHRLLLNFLEAQRAPRCAAPTPGRVARRTEELGTSLNKTLPTASRGRAWAGGAKRTKGSKPAHLVLNLSPNGYGIYGHRSKLSAKS